MPIASYTVSKIVPSTVTLGVGIDMVVRTGIEALLCRDVFRSRGEKWRSADHCKTQSVRSTNSAAVKEVRLLHAWRKR